MKRLLADTKQGQGPHDPTSVNVYLPETESSIGSIATGGRLKIDSVDVHTLGAGTIASFDLSQLFYPYNRSHVALVKTDGTDAGVIFDGAFPMGTEWVNIGAALPGLENVLTTPVDTYFAGALKLDIDKYNGTVSIRSTQEVSPYKGDTFELYIRSDTSPQSEIVFSGNYSDTYSGSFDITIDGTTYSVSYSLSGQPFSEVLTAIKEALNGETATTTVGVTSTTPSPLVDHTCSISGDSLLFHRKDDSALDFTLTRSGVNTGGLVSDAINYTSSLEFSKTLLGDGSFHTDSINVLLGSQVVLELVQANGDFDYRLNPDSLHKKIRAGMNQLPDFTPDGVGIEGAGSANVKVYSHANGATDTVTITIGNETVSQTGMPITTSGWIAAFAALADTLPNVSANDDGVDTATLTPIPGKDIGDGTITITSTESYVIPVDENVPGSGLGSSESVIDLNQLLLSTTAIEFSYNQEDPSLAVVGDGATVTSNAVPLSGGSVEITAQTSLLTPIKQGRKGGVANGFINLDGFVGYILINEFPVTNGPWSQDDILQIDNNILSVGPNAGLGFEDLFEAISNIEPYYHGFLRVVEDFDGTNRRISNTVTDYVFFKIWRSAAGYINISHINGMDPFKVAGEGFKFDPASEVVLIDDTHQLASPIGKYLVFTLAKKGANALQFSLCSNSGGDVGGALVSTVVVDTGAETKVADILNKMEDRKFVEFICANTGAGIKLANRNVEGD